MQISELAGDMPLSNHEVAARLYELGTLTELAGESPFKKRAYHNAAEQIDRIRTPLTDINVRSIVGIGESITSRIAEIIQTGTCEKLEELRGKYGHLLTLMEIPGVGPKTAIKLGEMGARSVEDVKNLIAAHKITDKRVLGGINIAKSARVPYDKARDAASKIIHAIKMQCPECQAEAAGSLRRGKATIGDIDIIVSSDNLGKLKLAAKAAIPTLTEDGESKIGGVVNGIHVDVRFAEPSYFGAMMLYFTGSKMFDIQMRRVAITKGWRLNEYGLWDKDNQLIAAATEQSIFDALGMEYKEPSEREI